MSRLPPPPRPTADIPPGARKTPPRIGLQIYSTPLFPLSAPLAYEPSIMHRPIPPNLHQITATTDASVTSLAAAFNLPVATVATNWLTSRSPMELPGYDRRISHNPSNAPSRPAPSPPQHVLDKYKILADALTAKLAAHLSSHRSDVNPSAAHSRPSRRALQHELDQVGVDAPRLQPPIHMDHGPHTAAVFKARPPRPHCGFSQLATHAQLQLSSDRKSVRKEGGGLYRVSMGSAQVGPGGYAEFQVVTLGGSEGGMAVGVGPEGHALNRLPGSDGKSAGLHAGGWIVTDMGEWRRGGPKFREGDIVGVMVGTGEVEFYVNGRRVAKAPVGTDGVRFVACLYQEAAEMRIRCCREEWEFVGAVKNRQGVRACCFGVEDVEAEMSSTSAASGCEESGWKNRSSPRRTEEKDYASCESAFTP